MNTKKSYFIFLLLIIVVAVFSLTACNSVEFKIEFMVDGEVYSTVNTGGEAVVKMPENPKKEGYVFDGWYLDDGVWKKPFTANSLLEVPLSESIKVYAKWIKDGEEGSKIQIEGAELVGKNTFSLKVDNETDKIFLSDVVETDPSSSWTLTYDIEGNNAVPSKAVNLNVGDNTYYILLTDKDGNVDVFELIIRRKPIYTVTFNAEGGSDVEPQRVQEGDLIEPPTSEKIGYELGGWSYDFTQPVTQNITANAIWKAKEYNVTLNTDGGSLDGQIVKVVYDSAFELPVPEKDGCKFVGWIYNGAAFENGVWTIDGDITVSASWQKETYKITYYLDDGQNNSLNPDSFTVDDIPYTLSDATKQGYVFDGWYTKDFAEKVEKITDCRNTELYAAFRAEGFVYALSEDKTFYVVEKYSGTDRVVAVENIYKGKDIKTIGESAFENCEAMQELYLGENIQSIGYRAFSGCVALESVVLPASLRNIGQDAFDNCAALTAVFYEAAEIDWEEIRIDASNQGINNATVYFYCKNKPSVEGNFWHYVQGEPVIWDIDATYTYNTYTAVSPSDWNELTYMDSNNDQIINYINSPFFEFDYKFDDKGEIVPGAYEVEYSAAKSVEDVTAKYADKYGYATGSQGFAWKITLRNDLKWDDGTPIKADDFVYSVQEQLNPLFRHFMAYRFYDGYIVIRNARSYANQGVETEEIVSNLYPSVSDAQAAGYTDIYLDINAVDQVFTEWFGGTYAQVKDRGMLDQCFMMYDELGQSLGQNFFEKYDLESAVNGQIRVTEQMLADYNKCKDWNPNADAEVAMLSVIKNYVYPEVSFDEVGIFVGDNEYELVLCLDKAIPLLKEDGSLSYIAAYQLSSLPLVKKDLYEACKTAPEYGNEPWTTKYNKSVDTTASWGPYKLTYFEAGGKYVLERNEYWYGYTANLYEGQYQTDKIVCETVGTWAEAWLKFQKGEIDNISMDISIAQDYKGSEQAYFTPTDFVCSLQLQSDEYALKRRETAGVNKTILTYTEFRKALSFGIDRAAFANACTTSALPGFGLFNSMHYYDVENGGAYRESDAAKLALCNLYGVDVSKFNSLDDAVNSITGYDIAKARELVDTAYDKAIADGKMKEGDKVVLVWGAAEDNDASRRAYNFVNDAWTELMVGTKLEGKFEVVFDYSFGGNWANEFRNGAYDVCAAGWTGSAWDIANLLSAYISPEYMYSTGWNTLNEKMTLTMPVKQADGSYIETELTMSLVEWLNCLNGVEGCAYNWSASEVSSDVRLPLIAALEEKVLSVYYTLPIYNDCSASLMSFKTDYISYEYNTFMEYGGIRYMTYNYSDNKWEEFVNSHSGIINYR